MPAKIDITKVMRIFRVKNQWFACPHGKDRKDKANVQGPFKSKAQAERDANRSGCTHHAGPTGKFYPFK